MLSSDRPLSIRAGSIARASCAALGVACAAGCMQHVDPQAARAQFSSKERSLPPSAARPQGARGSAAYDAMAVRGSEGSAIGADGAPSDDGAAVLHPPVLSEPIAVRTDAVPTESESANAATILRAAIRSNWAALRANAIEASKSSPSLLAELAPRGLVDENRGVRFVACMAIAESGLQGATLNGLVPQITPLLEDSSSSVRAAAMLALHRSGQKVNFTPLAAMLQDNDPEIRANAYLVLGELGNESAIPLIRQSLGRGMKLVNPLRVRLVDLAAAEALVKLGEEFEVEPIRAALFAPPEQASRCETRA
jgi:hypothetical protein